MTISRSCLCAVASALAVAVPTAAVAHAVARRPIEDCGDVATLDDDGVFIGAATAQGGACTNARAIAARVARSTGCKSRRSCRQRTYTCLLATAGKVLTLVRCENGRQTAFIRFEFGS